MGASLPDIRAVRDIEWYNLRRSSIKKFMDFRVRHHHQDIKTPSGWAFIAIPRNMLADGLNPFAIESFIFETLKFKRINHLRTSNPSDSFREKLGVRGK